MSVKIISSKFKIQCDSEAEKDSEIEKYRADGFNVIDLWSGDGKFWVTVEKIVE